MPVSPRSIAPVDQQCGGHRFTWTWTAPRFRSRASRSNAPTTATSSVPAINPAPGQPRRRLPGGGIRRGNVHSAEGWPEIVRQQQLAKAIVFWDRRCPHAGAHEVPKPGQELQVCTPPRACATPTRAFTMDIPIQLNIPLYLRSRLSTYAKPLVFCAAVVFASRLTLFVVGDLSQKFMGSPQGLAASQNLSEFWTRWDANWYLSIVRDGYKLSTNYAGNGETNVAFFPLWPDLLLLTSPFLSLNTAVLLLPNLLLLIGTVILHDSVRRRFDESVANLAVVSVCSFPGSFEFSSPMTESLFFMLVILTFHCINLRKVLPACFAAALLSITRVNGIAAGFTLGIGWLRDRLLIGWTPTLFRELFLILLIPIPVCAFMAFQFWRFGDGFASFNAHTYFWSNTIGWPFENLFYILYGSDVRARLQSGMALLAICVFILEINSFTFEEACFVAISILLTTSTQWGGLVSIMRYLLPLFPIHIAIALAAARRKWAAPLIPCFAIMNGFLMVFWSQGGTFLI